MEIYERIRKLRKNHLRMSQTDFGERLGVSRSVINNIERNALAKPEQKLSLLKLICKEFFVNEEWLMNGTEPMFVKPETFSLHDFAKERGMTELEMEIIKTYFELDPDIRKMLIEHFKAHLQKRDSLEAKDTVSGADAAVSEADGMFSVADGAATGKPEEEPTLEELEEEYKKSRLRYARNAGTYASSTTGGTGTGDERVSGA